MCGLCAQAAAGTLTFTDVTAQSGVGGWIQDSADGAYPYGEGMMFGGCVGDFNADGWQELYIVAGGIVPDRLFINNADGTFTDRAAQWNVDRRHLGVGASAADFNRDGHTDIFVTSFGPVVDGVPMPNQGTHILYRNNGDGTFTDIATQAGIHRPQSQLPDGFGSTFGDVDSDGDLDLLVLGWTDNTQENRLFRNNGDETFTDITSNALGDDLGDLRGFSPAICDMNGDLLPELLLVGDFRTSRYFANNGDGTFTDRTADSGTSLEANGMGSCIADFDADGRLDWYVTSTFLLSPEMNDTEGVGNMLYLNRGDHLYDEVSAQRGVSDGGWGWGARAVDLDHDRDIDIVETNGRQFLGDDTGTIPSTAMERGYVFINNGNASFADAAEQVGFDHNGQGRALISFDYDNDGDTDILVLAHGEEPILYRNDLAGLDTNWLKIRLDPDGDERIPPAGIGSTVRITAQGVTTIHPMIADCSYLATSEHTVHVGLGAARIVDDVLVTWPNGRRTRLTDVPANRTITIAPTCDADADGDANVNFSDLTYIIARFGATTADADTDASGVANFSDLLFSLARFGPCPD